MLMKTCTMEIGNKKGSMDGGKQHMLMEESTMGIG